jgi:hypothetical protein
MKWPTVIEIFDAYFERTSGKKKLIARVKTDGKKGEVEVFAPEYRRAITELFTMRHHEKRHAGDTRAGHFVAVQGVLEPWTAETIAHVIEHELAPRSLRAERVVGRSGDPAGGAPAKPR